VSVSLNEDIIENLDKLKSLGFSGRSEIIRAGITDINIAPHRLVNLWSSMIME